MNNETYSDDWWDIHELRGRDKTYSDDETKSDDQTYLAFMHALDPTIEHYALWDRRFKSVLQSKWKNLNVR